MRKSCDGLFLLVTSSFKTFFSTPRSGTKINHVTNSRSSKRRGDEGTGGCASCQPVVYSLERCHDEVIMMIEGLRSDRQAEPPFLSLPPSHPPSLLSIFVFSFLCSSQVHRQINKQVKATVWMAHDYPLKLRHIMPALEILSVRVSLGCGSGFG